MKRLIFEARAGYFGENGWRPVRWWKGLALWFGGYILRCRWIGSNNWWWDA